MKSHVLEVEKWYAKQWNLLKAYDPELGRMMQAEYDRQARNIELIVGLRISSAKLLWLRWVRC